MSEKPGYLAFLPGSYQVLGPEQIHTLDQYLDRCAAGNVDASGVVEFWVETPNVRARTRVNIVLTPVSGQNPQTTANTTVIGTAATLWVCEKEKARDQRVQSSPVKNVVGTGAAPLAVPTDTRLWGYSFEIETNGQELYGRFTPPASAGAGAPAHSWHIIVRYEAVVPLSAEEWRQFKQRQYVRVVPDGGQIRP